MKFIEKSINKTPSTPRQTRLLLAAMTLLQAAWFGAIWLTGTVRTQKIPLLLAYTLLVGASFSFTGRTLHRHTDRWYSSLQATPQKWLAGLALGVVWVGVVYAVYQRVWRFDEQGAINASRVIAQQGVAAFFSQYTQLPWLGAQHPPLIMLLNGLVLWLFGNQMIVARLVTVCFTLGTVLLTYQVGRRFYDATTGILAAFALVTFPLFLRLGAVVMTDVQVTFFATLTIYLLSRLDEQPGYRLALSAGLALGLGLLTKYTAVLMFPVILSYFLIHRSFIPLFRKITVVAAVASVLLLIWLGFAYSVGIFSEQQARLRDFAGIMARAVTVDTAPAHQAATVERAPQPTVSVESSPNQRKGGQPTGLRLNYGARLALETIVTRLPSALGVYTLPLLLLGAASLWRNRQRADWFIFTWIALVWLALFLTLPDHRYFMLTFPALSILLARGLFSLRHTAPQVLLLALFYCAGALYLFVDWVRSSHLFLQ